MKKRIQTIITSALLVLGLAGGPLLVAAPAFAATKDQICKGVTAAGGAATCTGTELNGLIATVINVLLFVVGAIAVIMIIIGGFRYVLSGGDQSKVTSAKNTILYSVVGLVVAAMAYAIVNFVVSKI